VLPCVDVFVADEFCVWATILRTCLALRWGAQLRTCRRALRCGRALGCVGAPNLQTCRCYVVDVPCIALTCPCVAFALLDVRWGIPTCGRALHCVGAPNLRTVPCVAFGRPSCGRALRCVGAANLGEAVLKSLPPSQNLFLSILQLVF
jgi:hypothetical protein